MTTRPDPFSFLPAVLCVFLSCCGPPAAAPAADAAEDEPEPIVTTLFGERVLLFVEYPHLVRGEEARFLAHFTVLATGEPVRAGRAVLQAGPTTLAADAPTRDGLFIPVGAFPEAGRFPARLSLAGEQATETLDLGELVVHATRDEARAAAEAAAAAEPPDVVPFLLEQQWKVGLLLHEAGPRRLTERLVVPARVVSAEGAEAVVAAPASGRLVAPPDGRLVRSGERVAPGRRLALVEPPLSGADAAQLHALALEWDLASLGIERDLADATARLGFATKDHERVAQLRPKGLASQQQLDQAARDLALAEAALETARAAHAALEETRARRERAGTATLDGILRLAVDAPIGGVVVSAGRVVGESVEAGEELYRIVDRERLWVEGRVSEFDLAELGDAPPAAVSFPALPGRRVAAGAPLALGPTVAEDSRTVRVRYALEDPGGEVRPGMLAELEIALDASDAAVAVPVDAVVTDQGLPTAYVMLEGELFQRRELELGLRDGDLVEVRAGIEPGERVATRGAALVRAAALSPTSFGHGHAH